MRTSESEKKLLKMWANSLFVFFTLILRQFSRAEAKKKISPDATESKLFSLTRRKIRFLIGGKLGKFCVRQKCEARRVI